MELAIEAWALERHFGPTKALDHLHLSVAAGSIVGRTSTNGAGKTTAVRVLTTLLHPDGGWAKVAGYDVVTEASDVRRRIGFTARICRPRRVTHRLAPQPRYGGPTLPAQRAPGPKAG